MHPVTAVQSRQNQQNQQIAPRERPSHQVRRIGQSSRPDPT
ncbi:hypothetical protein FM103_06940 [Corynebacterium xerosis]|nr:hypothetical protein FM103_06940 [Corynebacterium xerosis]